MVRQPYTVGRWITKVGSENDFIAAWSKFANWTAKNQKGAGKGYLLQDPDRPHHFLSYGPWESVEPIKAWRDRAEFKDFVVIAKELCEEFEPQLLFLVASSEQ